jgi:hypothetical protein
MVFEIAGGVGQAYDAAVQGEEMHGLLGPLGKEGVLL